MSTENANPVDEQPNNPVDEGKKQTVSYESHQKLLNEKKQLQKNFESINSRLEQYETEKLEAEGKIKELNEKLKLDKKALIEKTQNLTKTVQDKVLYSQFATKATALGCQDVKLAYQAIDLSDVDVTSDLEFDSVKLDEKLSSLTKEKPFLFKSQVQTPNNLIPSNNKGLPSDLSKLSNSDLEKLI